MEGKGLRQGLLALLWLGVGSAAAEPDLPRAWAGSYLYEHDAGRTAGGSAMVVAYRLDLAPGRGNRDCLVRIEGFQSDETLVCKVGGTDTAVTVAFHSFGDGRTVNAYGVRLYEIGQPLFELRRDRGTILTRWRGLNPGAGDAPPPPAGLFFAPRR